MVQGGGHPTVGGQAVNIIPLTPDLVGRLWLVSESHYTVRLLREHLQEYPHLGWMVKESGDYMVGGYWKNRPAIGQIMESTASPHREELLSRLLQAYRSTGSELVVLSEREETRARAFYLGRGFVPLEDIICYERRDMSPPVMARRLHVRRLEEADLAALVKLEQEAFPWLWWETADSFRQQAQRADYWFLVGYLGDELVGYLILAVRGPLGHLNRIGVHPRFQGQGFGQELLAVAIEELARHGARVIGLNTQSYNTQSQRLYEGFGFTRTGELFRIYGKWLE